jgi:steroid delta-isomerase-like uncharacterized protein
MCTDDFTAQRGDTGIVRILQRTTRQEKPTMLTTTMTAEQNKATIQRYFDAQNAHDLQAAFAFLRPDARSHSVPGSPEVAYLEDIQGFFTMFHDAVPDFHVTVHDVIAADDKVVVRFTINGTLRVEMMGQPAGGQYVENVIAIYRLADGRIAEVWS